MKVLALVAFTAGLVLAGCRSIPPEAAQRLDDAQHRFAAVQHGMAKAEVIARLGDPQRAAGGRLIWEDRHGAWNAESLAVEFDADDRVSQIRRLHLDTNRPSTNAAAP